MLVTLVSKSACSILEINSRVLLMKVSSQCSCYHYLLLPSLLALDWAKRRMKLDDQEAELLTRVHGVRRKVAQQMMQSTSSYSSN